jgi:hypothetical protein
MIRLNFTFFAALLASVVGLVQIAHASEAPYNKTFTCTLTSKSAITSQYFPDGSMTVTITNDDLSIQGGTGFNRDEDVPIWASGDPRPWIFFEGIDGDDYAMEADPSRELMASGQGTLTLAMPATNVDYEYSCQ